MTPATVVTVTWPHIIDAEPGVTRNPLALAVADAMPRAERIVAGARTLYLTEDGERREYRWPQEAADALDAWFAGFGLEPFSFAIPAEPLFTYRDRPVRARAKGGRAA